MKLGPTLTTNQERQLKILRDRWLQSIFSTRPANRKKAEEGVRRTYRAAGVRDPELFLWFDGLLEAAIAAEQLGPLSDANWMLSRKALARRTWVQRDLRHRLGLRTWRQVIETIGPRHTRYRSEEREVLNRSGFGKRTLLIEVAVECESSLQAGLASYDPFDPKPVLDCPAAATVAREIDQSARNFREQQRRLFSCHMGPGSPGHSSLDILSPVFDRDYPFGFLAKHDFLSKVFREQASLAYAGLCITAHNCSAWWPFANAAILADRPRELHMDGEGRLHNIGGPAIIYRSGLELHARHGSYESGCVRQETRD